MVPQADHAPALRFEERRAQRVARPRFEVLASVEFDDQAGLDAGEVDGVRADGMLATELQPAQASVAQVEPQGAFGVGAVATQLAGECAGREAGHGESFRWVDDVRRSVPVCVEMLPQA